MISIHTLVHQMISDPTVVSDLLAKMPDLADSLGHQLHTMIESSIQSGAMEQLTSVDFWQRIMLDAGESSNWL
jgi:hypothetical protein